MIRYAVVYGRRWDDRNEYMLCENEDRPMKRHRRYWWGVGLGVVFVCGALFLPRCSGLSAASADSKVPATAPRPPAAGIAASPKSPPRKGDKCLFIFLPADVRQGKIVLLVYPQPSLSNARSQEDRIRSALRKLFAYPAKADERSSKRLHTAIPPGVEIRKVQLAKNDITIDLNSRVLDFKSVEKSLPFSTMRSRSALVALAQIVFTATQWSHHSSVSIRIEGRKRSRLGNADISKAWSRKDFRSYFVVTDNGGRPIAF
jgi:hypothetical protein